MSTYTFSYVIIIIIIITTTIVALDSAGWLNLKFLEEDRVGSAGYYNKALCSTPLPPTTGLWSAIAQNLSLSLRFSQLKFVYVSELLFVLPPLPHIVLSLITLILSDERYVLWFLRLHSPTSRTFYPSLFLRPPFLIFPQLVLSHCQRQIFVPF